MNTTITKPPNRLDLSEEEFIQKTHRSLAQFLHRMAAAFCEETVPVLKPVQEQSVVVTGRTAQGKSSLLDFILNETVPVLKPVQKRRVVIFGETGGGKRTLVNFLLNDFLSRKSSSENSILGVHQEKEKPRSMTSREWMELLKEGYDHDAIYRDWQLLEKGRELQRRRSGRSGRRFVRGRGRRQLRKRKSGHIWRSKYTGPKLKLISGVYRAGPQDAKGQVQLKMEHCATSSSEMIRNPKVKCRKKTPENKKRGSDKPWVNIADIFPGAKVELGRNYVELSLNAPLNCYEFAVFGTPMKNDRKRMQMGVFGEKPVQGRDWKIWVALFDDTRMAFQHVCDMEERRGHRLLTTLAGLFVSNSDEDIQIDLSPLESGWEIMGSNIKTIKSKDAWNSPENSTDFPRCHFEIIHVDETKQSFFCGITASHGNDTAETEVIEFYEEENEQNSNVDAELGNFTGDAPIA